MECVDSTDCAESLFCLNGACVNPCTFDNVCGQQALCSAVNHVAVCSCQPGFTGDPRLGCIRLQYCASDSQCSSGTKCSNGICSSKFL